MLYHKLLCNTILSLIVIVNNFSIQMYEETANMDLILSAHRANSLIRITICTCIHAKVISQTIIYSKPNPNQKNSNLEPEILTLFKTYFEYCKKREVGGLRKGFVFLASSLYLTHYSIIKELARGADRVCSQTPTLYD